MTETRVWARAQRLDAAGQPDGELREWKGVRDVTTTRTDERLRYDLDKPVGLQFAIYHGTIEFDSLDPAFVHWLMRYRTTRTQILLRRNKERRLTPDQRRAAALLRRTGRDRW